MAKAIREKIKLVSSAGTGHDNNSGRIDQAPRDLISPGPAAGRDDVAVTCRQTDIDGVRSPRHYGMVRLEHVAIAVYDSEGVAGPAVAVGVNQLEVPEVVVGEC